MKKTLAAFTLVASAALFAGAANTTTTPVDVNPQDLKRLETNYIVTIKAVKPTADEIGDSIHFEVLVQPKSGELSANAYGQLEIFDVEGKIVVCNVQRIDQGKSALFSFAVSARYLERSRFAFKATGEGPKGPTADVVWFHLKDFANKN